MAMSKFGLVGNGVLDPDSFHNTSATTKAHVEPIRSGLNRYYRNVIPQWPSWSSVRIVLPHGNEAMGLHSHMKDGALAIAIAYIAKLNGGAFRVAGC